MNFQHTVFHIFTTQNQQMQIRYRQVFILGISQFGVQTLKGYSDK